MKLLQFGIGAASESAFHTEQISQAKQHALLLKTPVLASQGLLLRPCFRPSFALNPLQGAVLSFFNFLSPGSPAGMLKPLKNLRGLTDRILYSIAFHMEKAEGATARHRCRYSRAPDRCDRPEALCARWGKSGQPPIGPTGQLEELNTGSLTQVREASDVHLNTPSFLKESSSFLKEPDQPFMSFALG